MSAKRWSALLLLAIVADVPLAPAQVKLNPTVTLLSQPSGPVPAECETGLTTAAPRAELGETPAPPAALPPPSAELAATLGALEAAAASDDYADFKAALTAARAAVTTYPRGGERDAANDVLAIYGDIERLWD